MKGKYNTWNKFKSYLQNCPYSKCYRNENKMTFLFERRGETLHRIKFIVISQEPSIVLKKDFYELIGIEQFLISECYQKRFENLNRRGIPFAIRKIVNGKRINPEFDEIYWTHALKCFPKDKNDEIKINWKKCAPYCINHLKDELSFFQNQEIGIITFGGYALTMCLNLFGQLKNLNLIKIVNYIKEFKPEIINYKNNHFIIYPFIHPSNKNRILKTKEDLIMIEAKEKEFKKQITEKLNI